MNKSTSDNWPFANHFAFRVFSIYFLFYILFISSFLNSFVQVLPILQHLNKPFKHIGTAFGRWFYHLLTHKSFPSYVPIHIMDTSWNFAAALGLMCIAIILAIAWSRFDSRKAYPRLLSLVQIILRYYLIFILFYYGIGKLFLSQFQSPPSPAQLLTPLYEYEPRGIFWRFMGISKSYQFFAGLLEVAAGLLLLFRKTTLIGAFLSVGLFINILMLNIGYDTQIKLFLIHLILFSIYIIAPDINKLYLFLIKRQPGSLPDTLPAIQLSKHKWVMYLFKFILVSFFIYLNISKMMFYNKQNQDAPFKHIAGLYEIKDWKPDNPDSMNSSLRWKKMAIDPEWGIRVMILNDSLIDYGFNKDSSKTDFLYLKNDNDSSFTGRFRYSKIGDERIIFRGILNKDSISFISSKIDLNKTPLLKTYGKTKWFYDE